MISDLHTRCVRFRFQASQRLRCHPNLVQVFATLYATDDLVGSVDAPAVLTAHTLRDRSPKERSGLFAGSSLKPHVDMTLRGPSSTLNAHLQTIPGAFPSCVQGCVVCRPQEPTEHPTAGWVAPPGFVAMPGLQPPVVDTGKKEFRCLPDEEIEAYRVLERLR
jgi:hypothetical protein